MVGSSGVILSLIFEFKGSSVWSEGIVLLPELEELLEDEPSEVFAVELLLSEVELLLLFEVELLLSDVLAVEFAVELSDVELLSEAEVFELFDPEASEVFVLLSESSIAVSSSLLVSSVSFVEELAEEELLLLFSVVFVELSVTFTVLSDVFELPADSVVVLLLFAVVSAVPFVAFVTLPLSEVPAVVSFEAVLSVLLVAAVLSFKEPWDDEELVSVEVVFERSVEFEGSEVDESDWARKAVMKRNRRRR